MSQFQQKGRLKKRHGMRAVAFIGALALALSACSSTAATPSPATSAPATSAPTTAAPASSAPASAATSNPTSAAASAAACVSKPSTTIAMIPKALSIPYFDVSSKGAQQAAQELGITVKVIGPSDPTAAAQIPFVNTATQQQVSGISLAADDAQALAPAMKQATAAGVKATTFDSDVSQDARTIFVNQVDPKEFALAMLSTVAEQMNYTGQLALVSGLATAQNQNDWLKIMQDELKNNPKYANVQLAKIAYSDSVDQKSTEVFNGLLQTYPDLKGVIALDAVALPASARALQQSGRKLALGGAALPNAMKAYVKDGTVKNFVLWDVQKLGYLSIFATDALVNGCITGAAGDKFTAGSLGSFTVGDNGVIILGPSTIFDASNIDQFNF
jgi:rhamnose transport system substrate-binding protein